MIRGIGSGTFSATFKDGDKDRTVFFQFGPLASAYSEAESKLGIFDMFNVITAGHGSLYFLHYFFGGAVAYADFNKQQRPTFPEVVEWCQLIPEEVLLEIYYKSLVHYLPKEQAPETGQQVAV
jgi:hypothetical protein